MKKIACIGSVTADIIVKPANSIPPAGTLRAVDSVEMHVGGCASNAAIDIAKLGLKSELICCVGDDAFGEFVASTCEKCGVGTKGIYIKKGEKTTGSVACIHSNGERSFLYNPASSGAFTSQMIDQTIINDCEIIFVAGAFLLSSFDGKPCADFMKQQQSKGKFTVMDTAWDFNDVWLPTIRDVLPFLDLFMPSIDEAAKIAGSQNIDEICNFFFDLGVKSVIIKNGKKGAYICESRDKRYESPTYTSIKPVDTTGAGDSFCAGFLSGLAMGWSYKDSAMLGNAVGTHCIMCIGASSGIKPLDEIISFMKNTKMRF